MALRAEVLNMVSGQLHQFLHKPFQFYMLPAVSRLIIVGILIKHKRVRSRYNDFLVKKSAIVRCEHEKGRIYFPNGCDPKEGWILKDDFKSYKFKSIHGMLVF